MAWLTAQSLLDQVRGSQAILPGLQQGMTLQGLSWAIQAEPYSQMSDGGSIFAPVPGGVLQPLRIEVKVRWGKAEGQSIRLESVELTMVPRT